jgi:hypothetical protein
MVYLKKIGKREIEIIGRKLKFSFQTVCAYPFESECISSIIYIRKWRKETTSYEGSICNVVK